MTARIFTEGLRTTDIVARLGGDEFAILLPCTPPEAGALVTLKLQNSFLSEMEKWGWPVTLSVGLVTYLEPPGSVEDMLKLADSLMYEVKSRGKNGICQEIVGEAPPVSCSHPASISGLP